MTPPKALLEYEPGLVSVLLLCYNHERYVAEAMQAAFAQTYKRIEILVADDASRDASSTVIDSLLSASPFPIRFIRHSQNQGVCRTLNELMRLARGEFINFIATDDVMFPDKIALQVNAFAQSGDEVGLVYTDGNLINEHGAVSHARYYGLGGFDEQEPVPGVQDQSVTLVDRNPVLTASAMVHRRVYDRIGLYDEALPYEDWDFFLRTSMAFRFCYLPTLTVSYRRHSESLSQAVKDLKWDEVVGPMVARMWMRAALQRHRRVNDRIVTRARSVARSCMKQGDWALAQRFMMISIVANPGAPSGWRLAGEIGLKRLRHLFQPSLR